MLEPTRPQILVPGRWRAAAMRHGFDLEPELPDPAPAFVDPDAPMHPALTEPLSLVPLHSFPTKEARSALVGRLLSEPSRGAHGEGGPFAAIERFAEQRGMEPEVLGCIHLLALRGHLAQVREGWRAPVRDPAIALRDPDQDPWRLRRPRLRAAGRGGLERIARILDLAARLRETDPALAFERESVAAAADWLSTCVAWWRVVDVLGDDEAVPADPEARHALSEALLQARRAVAGSLDLDLGPDPAPARLLGAVCAAGLRSELDFLGVVGERPDGPVSAQWLLLAQFRSLRDVFSLTRDRSFRLHQLLRACDRARVATQIAWRLAMIDLWLADAEERSCEEAERLLLHLPDPLQPTTLFAGVGRVRGFVLLRRLRRGETDDAGAIAMGALHLAPEELAVRIAWNDLRWHGGHPRRGRCPDGATDIADWDPALLASLRLEADRWASVSVGAMATDVARYLGDRSALRRFRQGLVDRALEQDAPESWCVAVVQVLNDPADRMNPAILDRLISRAPASAPDPGPLSAIVYGSLDPQELGRGFLDLQMALLEAREACKAISLLEATLIQTGGAKPEAWRQILQRSWPSTPGWEGEVTARIQSLRAAAPALRTPPIAGALRAFVHAVERVQEAPDLPEGAEVERALAREAIQSLPDALRRHLGEGGAEEAVQRSLEAATDHLRRAVRHPRMVALSEELRRLGARFRARGDEGSRADVTRLIADLAGASGTADPDGTLDRLESEITRLDLASPALVLEPSLTPAADLMGVHPDFDRFSVEELGLREDALPRVHELITMFNVSGGRRDRKRIKGSADFLFELRARGARWGAIRVFYRQEDKGWMALAAMRKHDDRDQRDAISRVARAFGAVRR